MNFVLRLLRLSLSVPASSLALSSSSVSVPATLPTTSVSHQCNQVTESGPSLEAFKSILSSFFVVCL